jgi:hypothetical protein
MNVGGGTGQILDVDGICVAFSQHVGQVSATRCLSAVKFHASCTQPHLPLAFSVSNELSREPQTWGEMREALHLVYYVIYDIVHSRRRRKKGRKRGAHGGAHYKECLRNDASHH